MSRAITVTPEELTRTANSVEGKTKEYVSLYNKLYSEVDSMSK
ncbi:MAG: WXG100 family type VII secretion target, partial [Peptococcaceae bacterium]|nr:WXG100 family type VII secretion target [Peptococcaceae bacterium]